MSFRPVLILGLALAAPAEILAQPPTVRIEATDHQSIQAVIGYDVRTQSFQVTRWLVYIPEPPELPSQSKPKVTSEPGSKVIAEKSPLARKLRQYDITVDDAARATKLVIRQDIQTTLRSRRLVPLKENEKPPTVPSPTLTERKFYLAPSKRIDFDQPDFKNWLTVKKLRLQANELPIDYAARVLEVIRSDFTYRFEQKEEKRASISCQKRATDCGGMSFVFVAAMRANGIPARVLMGRFALPREAGSTPNDTGYDQPHVRAEFFVNGVGWVPADPSLVNRDTHKPVKEFVGFDPGDMLVLHVDLDFRVPTMDKEQTIDQLQVEPFVWTTGMGKLDLRLAGSRWEVKTTPVSK